MICLELCCLSSASRYSASFNPIRVHLERVLIAVVPRGCVWTTSPPRKPPPPTTRFQSHVGASGTKRRSARPSRHKSFNPTWVRLELSRRLHCYCRRSFNPTWVRLELAGRRLVDWRLGTFNPTWVRLELLPRYRSLIRTPVFQSHVGASGTPTSPTSISRPRCFQSHVGASGTTTVVHPEVV